MSDADTMKHVKTLDPHISLVGMQRHITWCNLKINALNDRFCRALKT